MKNKTIILLIFPILSSCDFLNPKELKWVFSKKYEININNSVEINPGNIFIYFSNDMAKSEKSLKQQREKIEVIMKGNGFNYVEQEEMAGQVLKVNAINESYEYFTRNVTEYYNEYEYCAKEKKCERPDPVEHTAEYIRCGYSIHFDLKDKDGLDLLYVSTRWERTVPTGSDSLNIFSSSPGNSGHINGYSGGCPEERYEVLSRIDILDKIISSKEKFQGKFKIYILGNEYKIER